MNLERYLDCLEVRFRARTLAGAIAYRGTIDANALARAYELMCSRHPVLLRRIRLDSDGYKLYVAPHHKPDFSVVKGDESVLYFECTRWFDEARGVARPCLVRGETDGCRRVFASRW